MDGVYRARIGSRTRVCGITGCGNFPCYTFRQIMNRIPTLDGWRGIAILMVLAAHLQTSLLRGLYGGFRWLDLGQHGVTLFFVLSGYLITTRLLSKPGIDLKAFYLRRFFRLMPCAWVYLL